MNIVAIALFSSSIIGLSDAEATGFRALVERATHKESRTAADAEDAVDQSNRELNNCWGDNTPAAAWHPTYSAGWTNGYCRFTVDCNSPSYTSEVACCNAAYAGQISGFCLSQLPNPPTTSPTDTGGLDVYYPDYDTPWTEAGCTNARPLPSGRPTYTSMSACCKGAYGGQVSGKCLSMLDSPPTASPTTADMVADFWYPDYGTAWPAAGCSNKLPLPFNNKNDRPNYSDQLSCCKGAYGGQTSGICLSQLPSPPTTSPTEAGGMSGVWYADYDTAWTEAGCINTAPLPSGRPTYSSRVACCKAAYGGQVSGKCLSELESPPTTSPTGVGGLDEYYPDYDTAWTEAGCINDAPLPSGRPTYSSVLACCKGAYAGQMSGKCLSMLPSPPTTSPTGAGGLDVYYPDYGTAWSEAGCINDTPLPSGRPTYSSVLACCKGAYAGQTSGKCLSMLPSPPTASPTQAGGLDVFYPNYNQAWPQGVCINDRPMPSGRPTYSSKTACCSGAYGGQSSNVCQCDANPCYSCKCGNDAFRTANSCTLTCS